MFNLEKESSMWTDVITVASLLVIFGIVAVIRSMNQVAERSKERISK